MTTIGQIAEWILKNRRGNAFKGYDINKIVSELDECGSKNAALVVTCNNTIVGVVCCLPDADSRVLHVFDILTSRKGILKEMLKTFHNRFKGYRIEGQVRNRTRTFTKTNRLQHLIETMSYGK